MNARLRPLAACLALLPGASVLAQEHVKPGLWEITVSTKTDNPAMEQMKARLAAMSPEQRAAMARMIPGMATGDAPNSMRVCITPEQAAHAGSPDANSRCARTNVVHSGNTTTFDMACGSMTGHGTMTRISDNEFTSSSTSEMTHGNQTTHMQTQSTSKFVSSNCGDVKPIQTTPTK